MKILITGGHVAPALAVIDRLKELNRSDELVFVGRKYALDSEETFSLEHKEIEKRKIKFVNLKAGRLTRLLSLRSVFSWLKIPLGFFQAISIIWAEKPDVILSFGSYIALPICLIGFLNGIPIYTHEQTISPGLTNRIIGAFAKKVFAAFEESSQYFPKNKFILAGNPVRKSIFEVKKKAFEIKKDRKVIYVTGGSLGSHSLNLHIKEIIAKLLNCYIVIHQVGDTKKYKDFEGLINLRENLPVEKKKNYFLAKHFFDDEIGYIYNMADLVVGRSGANTFFDLVALEKPALFVPLPWSANHEQQAQAEIFQTYQTGEIFSQFEESDKLLELIKKMMTNLGYYKQNFEKLKFFYQKDASQLILNEIISQKS